MTGETPRQWAARYAAADLPVLPLHSVHHGRCTCGRDCGRNIGKHPVTAHGKDDATIDPGQVAEWWSKWPWANVGIRPPAGLVVLDVDPRNGGATTLRALTEEHGPLPETLTARTGGGGLHIWLAYYGPTRGELCRGVDVKGHTGYVVAPPSLHASGNRYEWLAGRPTARPPQWVRRLLHPPVPPKFGPQRNAGEGDGLVRAVATAPEGQRNNLLNWAAYRAYQRGADPGLLAEIRDAAVTIGLPMGEVERTISSAARAAAVR